MGQNRDKTIKKGKRREMTWDRTGTKQQRKGKDRKRLRKTNSLEKRISVQRKIGTVLRILIRKDPYHF
jgi:hypothetical protein